MDASYYRDLLGEQVRGGRWIIVLQHLAAAGRAVEMLRELGADGLFVVAAVSGTGDPPPLEESEYYMVGGGPADSIMAEIREYSRSMVAPPAELMDVLEDFDPDLTARAVLQFPADPIDTIVGRQVFGPRRPEWGKLENKIEIGEFWDAADVAQAPYEIVAAERDAVEAAARRLDHGAGAAIVGDNREGWHGGGDYLRWVRTPDDLDLAVEFFAEHCDHVRVMPFLEGIPCSIHGMVIDGSVIAFRPAEMVNLRRRGDAAALQYAGAATYWDPPDADREDMRDVAKRVGAHLRDTVDYRGAFTVDGVMTADGFRPTELNPRYGAALAVVSSGLPELPLYYVHLMALEGIDGLRPAALELLVTDAADRTRGGGGWMPVPIERPSAEMDIVFSDSGAEPAGDRIADAKLLFGPGPRGGFLRCTLEPTRNPIGRSVGERVVAAFALASREWDLDLPEFEAIDDVRT